MSELFLRNILLIALLVVSPASWGQDTDLPFAEEVASPAVAEPLAMAQPERKLRPLTVTVGLTDDTQLTGTLLETSEVSIKTAFGEAAIPLSEVAGIRFPAADDSSTTVVMLNGDSITGATELKFVGIETAWGSAKVNGQSIGTLLFVPGLQWTATTSIGGKRWSLIETNSLAAQPVQQQAIPNNAAPGGPRSQAIYQGNAPSGQPLPGGLQPLQPSRVIIGQ
jgi:hypothetical protein